MMPAYRDNPWNALFFGLFLLVALLGLLNLLLATVYSNYREFSRIEALGEIGLQYQRLARAFNLMSDDREFITHDDWDGIMQLIRPKFTDQQRTFAFRVLDEDADGKLALEDFLRIPDILDWDITERSRTHHTFRQCFPSLFRTRGCVSLTAAFQSDWFDLVMNVIVVCNAVAVMVIFSERVNGNDDALDSARPVEGAFFALYLLEFLGKWLTMGTRAYFRKDSNVFDFVILATVALDVIVLSNIQGAPEELAAAILLFRLLRLTRLFGKIRLFRSVARATGHLLPLIVQWLGVATVLLYVFALLGMEVWAGRMPDSLELAQEANMTSVIESSYGANDYFALNFNTLGGAFQVLAVIVIVNNWHVIAAGFVALEGTRFVWLYFMATYLVAVLVIMNIFIAVRRVLLFFVLCWGFVAVCVVLCCVVLCCLLLRS
jgi:Ion transport protein